ncbi:MAG: glycoside hydrolase family 2 TIM barrel-domain containing protein [Thermoproteota archaeon]
MLTRNWTMGTQFKRFASNVKLPAKRIIMLNDDWMFTVDPEEKFTSETVRYVKDARKARAGLPWEAQFPDLVDYDGVAWYCSSFSIPGTLMGKRIILRFDAADYEARVWLNGVELGSHEGGYTPFEFEVTSIVKFGSENELTVRVSDPKDCSEIPNGKQSHYCNIGGLWQGVRLLIREEVYVHSVFIVPDIDNSTVRIRIVLSHVEEAPEEGLRLTLRVSPTGEEKIVKIVKDKSVYDVEMLIRELRQWSPDSPFLYRLEILLSGERVDDACFIDFGMRKIEARENRILLNGEPVYLMGALDQDFYPDVIYGTPSDEMLRDQFLKARELGLNFLRTHIKIPCPNYLEWADRIGVMLWIDFPSFYRFTVGARERMRRELEEWVWRDFNHPSVFCWCLVNEEWGVPLAEHEDARKWLKEMWRLMKRLDPTRLVVDNSPSGAGHIVSDIEDQHVYMAIPDHAREFEEWVNDFSKHPAWMFRFPESERRGFEPLMVSEFGNWGLPDVEGILRYYDWRDPYWFNQASYGGPIRTGVKEFFRLGLDEVYGSLRKLAEATQKHQLDSLKFEIETMRLHPEIIGYVITQFTDLNSESNGLMDMCRGVKLLHRFTRFFQVQDVVVIRPGKWSYLEGEEARVKIYVSRFSAVEPKAVEWWVENTPAGGVLKPVSVRRACCTKVGEANFRIPEAECPGKLTIWARLLDDYGREICRNYQEILVLPSWSVRSSGRISVFGADASVMEKIKEAGLTIVDPSQSYVAVSLGVNEEAFSFAEKGGRVLFLLEDSKAGSIIPGGIRLAERREKGRWGDWCIAFLWLKKEVTSRLFYEDHLGMPFIECIPNMVLEEVSPKDARKAFGGVFVGWMREPAATILPVKMGTGLAVLCTFRLVKNLVKDPVSTALFCSLVDLMFSEKLSSV